MDSAMVEPLFKERMARPGRESSSRMMASAASSAMTQTTGCSKRPLPRLKPATDSGGTPRMPSYLPSHSMLAMV